MHALASGPLLLYVITVHSNLVPNVKSKISEMTNYCTFERYFVELALHLCCNRWSGPSSVEWH